MAKKKPLRSKAKPKKTRNKLGRRFNCPKCNSESVVVCKIEKKDSRGHAFCTACEATFGCSANNLTHPIDIYSAWIDSLHK